MMIRCSSLTGISHGTAILGSAALEGMIAAPDKWTVGSRAEKADTTTKG